MDKLSIIEFADPVCTWCWGASPILRALEYRYGGVLEITRSMVGIIDDIRTYCNRRLEIGGDDIALSNRNMLKHWLEASKQHGMPVMEHGFHLFSEEHRSTMPQCMAYITAKICSPKKSDGTTDLRKANRYFRRIQEATAAEAVNTCDVETLVDLSAVEGFEPNRFREVMTNGEALCQFEKERLMAQHYNIQSTPSYLLSYNKKDLLLQGFTTYETLEHNIKQFTAGKLAPKQFDADGVERLSPVPNNIRHFISYYGSVYPVEIATAFGLKKQSGHNALNIESYEMLPDIISELLRDGKVAMTPKANTFMIYSLSESVTRTQQREHEIAGWL